MATKGQIEAFKAELKRHFISIPVRENTRISFFEVSNVVAKSGIKYLDGIDKGFAAEELLNALGEEAGGLTPEFKARGEIEGFPDHYVFTK